MSTIHVETLIEAMGDEEHTLEELAQATGYPFYKVLVYLIEARASGHLIGAYMSETPDEPTTFINFSAEGYHAPRRKEQA